MVAGKPGPARRPHLQAVKEGDKRAKSRPDPILLPPGAPPEPNWREREPDGPGIAGKARSVRIRKHAQHLWRLWVSLLDPQGILATLDESVIEEAALAFARLRETERQIAADEWIQDGQHGKVPHRLFTRSNQLQTAVRYYVPQLGLSPASRLEAREGGRLDADFDEI
jgi:hypothetical protein